MAYKTPLGLSDELLREARRNTLNKRINYKGNYENYITGGSHALNNQVHLDDNDFVKAMNNPNSGWNTIQSKIQETTELNDRYTNPEHNRRAGNSPYDSGLKYIHDLTPSTRRGRRLNDIFFNKKRNAYGVAEDGSTYEQIQKLVDQYEGRK